jgi:hypothetical protein
MNGKKKCYVIMPISKTKSCTGDEWTGIFDYMIKPAVTSSRLGYECERANPRTGAFIKDILEGLNRADVVIADLTDRNPNVCYELGIRHTLKNRTIIIAQNKNDVPSDLQPYWYVIYKKDLSGADEFKRKIREILREMQKEPDKSDSPVADFLQLKNIDILAYEKSANLSRLAALISELSYNMDYIDAIMDTIEKNKEKRGKKEKLYSVSNVRFCSVCLELLISTFYIKLPFDLLDLAKAISESIGTNNKRLDLWSNQDFSESVEKSLPKHLPELKKKLANLLKEIYRLFNEYSNDNYHEPKNPVILLATTEHKEYLQRSK